MKIAFIGGGNMAEAMLAAFLEKGLGSPEDIVVGEIDETRRRFLKEKYAVLVEEDNTRAVAQGEIIILAVKPQTLPDVLAGLRGRLPESVVVLSIIAGARIDAISSGLSYNRVVRAMPNTPARIGLGMTAWTAAPDVTGEQREAARNLLAATGREIYFDDEKYLDMATAVSGSGPAYFFLLAESLIEAAQSIGLTEDAARKMVLQTMLGSAQLMETSATHPGELRRNVTSPGGTTAAAIKVFEDAGFIAMVGDAVEAAYRRAIELGK